MKGLDPKSQAGTDYLSVDNRRRVLPEIIDSVIVIEISLHRSKGGVRNVSATYAAIPNNLNGIAIGASQLPVLLQSRFRATGSFIALWHPAVRGVLHTNEIWKMISKGYLCEKIGKTCGTVVDRPCKDFQCWFR